MTYPNSEQEARENISIGSTVNGMMHHEGFKLYFEPFLKGMLERADGKCHDYKIRVDRGKEAVVEYNTIKVIMNFFVEYKENMEGSIQYLRDNNIEI